MSPLFSKRPRLAFDGRNPSTLKLNLVRGVLWNMRGSSRSGETFHMVLHPAFVSHVSLPSGPEERTPLLFPFLIGIPTS